MKKVNVYIYSGIRTIKKTDGAAGYVLSYMTKKDIEATLSNIVYLEDVTRHDAELEVLNQALSRLNTKDIEIDIYTDSSYLTSALDLDWIHKWQQSGWKNSKGEPVKHADKWQKTLILLNGTRFYIYTNQHHEYSNWLKSQCEKKGPK